MKCSECKAAKYCMEEGSDPEQCDEYESNKISEYEAEEKYNEMLDEVYGDVEIAGMHYQTSRALKELDPIAYRCGFNDWLDSEGLEVD